MTDVATIKLGQTILEITNPNNIQPVSADILTEVRENNGVACLSFAAIITDGEAVARSEIVARIRLSLVAATALRSALDGLLKSSMPGKEAAN